MDLQKLVDEAWTLKKSGKLTEALGLYSQAFDVLVSEASANARMQEGTFEDNEENGKSVRKVLPKHFGEAKRYLKQDKTAAVLSNNMAVIFAELDDRKAAKDFFEQAIDLTPEGEEYTEPKMGLLELEKGDV